MQRLFRFLHDYVRWERTNRESTSSSKSKSEESETKEDSRVEQWISDSNFDPLIEQPINDPENAITSSEFYGRAKIPGTIERRALYNQYVHSVLPDIPERRFG